MLASASQRPNSRCARHPLGGTFFTPTVLTPAMAIANEESVGPVATLFRFETEAEAIRLANDDPYGLAAMGRLGA